jgi:spore germination protein YaaH
MKRKFLPGLLALAMLSAACGSLYTVPRAGDDGKPAIAKRGAPLEFAAWLVYWDELSVKSFEANVSRLKRVYPEAYTCQPDGMPGRIDIVKPEMLAATVATARQHGIKVLGTMNNYANEAGGFEPKRVQKFLHDPALMERHVDALIALAQADGLDGLDVDYESLAAADRGAFTAFVQRLSAKARPLGLLIGIAVHPKESEPGTWGGPQAQDYAALGAVVDFFHVMTYDYSWATGSAGSVAPLAWVRGVGAFAATKMPKEKIEIGVNGYGYNWGPKGDTLTWPKFIALQSKYGKAERDETSHELKIFYPGGEAWMSDAETSRKKFEIAQDLGVRGVAMWVLGQEDPKTWAVWDQFNGATR